MEFWHLVDGGGGGGGGVGVTGGRARSVPSTVPDFSPGPVALSGRCKLRNRPLGSPTGVVALGSRPLPVSAVCKAPGGPRLLGRRSVPVSRNPSDMVYCGWLAGRRLPFQEGLLLGRLEAGRHV